MKKQPRYPRRKPPRLDVAERAPEWHVRKSERNIFLRGVAEDALRLAREFAAKHDLTLSQVFDEAARHLPEIERQRAQRRADMRRWLDEVREMNEKSGLPEVPKGTAARLVREYRDE